jgi:hypothetical protein
MIKIFTWASMFSAILMGTLVFHVAISYIMDNPIVFKIALGILAVAVLFEIGRSLAIEYMGKDEPEIEPIKEEEPLH